MDEIKGALQSKTVWGGIIIVVATLAGFLGYQVTPDDQAQIIDLVTKIVDAVGGAFVIWGRIVATKKIG